MNGFTSEFEFRRYANLFALSLILSRGEDFWFNGKLYQACEAGDLKKIQRILVQTNPSTWIFVGAINWAEVARSAVAIYEKGNSEHNALLTKLNLLSDGGES